MAEITVSFVVEKVGDLLIQKAMFLEGVHGEVDRLKAELTRMQCFLKDLDARQHEHERVRNWVSEIRDLANQAEDAIDLYISSVVMPGKTMWNPWRIIKKLWNCNKTGKQLEGIQMKLQDIRTSLVTYGINSNGEATATADQNLQTLRYISPLVNENVVVGLKKETDELVQQLVGGDERRRVVSIVGLGGIGKTTLAKKVYKDPRVLDYFPQSYRAWVYVTQDCRPKDVFQQILNQLPYTPTEAETRKIEKFKETELGDFLHEYLGGKRFLLVLDDIWESEDWIRVGRAFPEESHGSRLLLTTRNTDLALQADARSAPHRMQTLSAPKSWKLFCRTAIPEEYGDTDSCPPWLEEMGQKMVKKCGGLPLAIVVLGGLLSLKPRSPTAWEIVLNNMQAHFARANGVDAVLSLSYVDLPHSLKSCFLYMGLFPEDQVISRRRLFQLWMAEGFVAQQDEDGQRKEGKAEEYWNELVNRNLVQPAKMSVNERVTKCRIHDLVRDLCIKKAKEISFFNVGSTSSSRRLGVYHEDWYASSEPSTPYIRSLLFFNMKQPTFTSSRHGNFKLLRVLDLGDVCLTIATIRFRKLIHLRYLRLQVEEDLNFPRPSMPNCWPNRRSSVDDLNLPTSLETLILESYIPFTSRAVQNLENLQHLSLCHSFRPQQEPLQMKCPRNLRTLSWILWSDWLQTDTGELTSLRKLKIDVNIPAAEAVTAPEFSNCIAKCENLRSLCISSGSDFITPCIVMNSWLRLTKLEMKGRLRKLPEAHELPPSLTQLTLNHTHLGIESMAILQNLLKLLTLRLRRRAFGKDVQVLKDGFPQLRNLLLLSCDFKMSIHKGGMPKLTWLQIYRSECDIQGPDELFLHLRKVDIDYDYDYTVPYLSNSSQWHEIRRRNVEGEEIMSYLRK